MKQLSSNERLEEIKHIYRDILLREAQTEELNYWHHCPLSIDEIKSSFEKSDEYKRLETIKDLYQNILSREAEPSGLIGWKNCPLPLSEIEISLKQSPEAKHMVRILKGRISNFRNTVSVLGIKPFSDVVEEAFNISSTQWEGSLHIHMPGKAGEMLFLLGNLPTVREMAPKSKIIIYTLPHYIEMVKNVLQGPDDVIPLDCPNPSLTRSTDEELINYTSVGFELVGSDLYVNAHRTNPWVSRGLISSTGPFYRGFADAIGAIPFSFSKPVWGPLGKANDHNRIALALATTTEHASVRRKLPFSSLQWKNLAETLRKRGLIPLVTGDRADPAPEAMPGWKWIDCNLVDAVTMILSAEYLVAGISGLAFAAASFGKAQTVIINERDSKNYFLYYGFDPSSVIDQYRLWSIFTPPDGSRDTQAYELALRIASEPLLRGGLTNSSSIS